MAKTSAQSEREFTNSVETKELKGLLSIVWVSQPVDLTEFFALQMWSGLEDSHTAKR